MKMRFQFIKFLRKSMYRREKITENYLLSHGYEKHISGDTVFYRNSDGRIEIWAECTNRYGSDSYLVHMDNNRFESVGSLEIMYVDELEDFIRIAYDK